MWDLNVYFSTNYLTNKTNANNKFECTLSTVWKIFNFFQLKMFNNSLAIAFILFQISRQMINVYEKQKFWFS